MKLIQAIIRPEKFADVKAELDKIQINGITISEVKGHGVQGGYKQQWRGVEYTVDLLPKVKLELVVSDKDAQKVMNTIAKAAKTGAIGDGKIFIIDVADAMRVRTGETGEDAI
jgi:nitrogen regulatory protein PII